MNHTQITAYREVRRAGWEMDSSPSVNSNSGSETDVHLVAKALVWRLCKDAGYFADTEVSHDRHGTVDVLAVSETKINRCIELETNPYADIIADKKRRYVDSNEVIEEIHVVAVDELPSNLYDLRNRLKTELGFLQER